MSSGFVLVFVDVFSEVLRDDPFPAEGLSGLGNQRPMLNFWRWIFSETRKKSMVSICLCTICGKLWINHHVYYGTSISRVYQWNTYESMGYLLLAGGFKHDFWIFHFIYGMSSFPLTNSYFSRWLKPPTSYMSLYYKLLFFSRHVLRFVGLFLVTQFRDCWTPASIFATQKVTNGERMGCFFM